MTRRRKKHRPKEIVAKLRDADAMLNGRKDLAAVPQLWRRASRRSIAGGPSTAG